MGRFKGRKPDQNDGFADPFKLINEIRAEEFGYEGIARGHVFMELTRLMNHERVRDSATCVALLDLFTRSFHQPVSASRTVSDALQPLVEEFKRLRAQENALRKAMKQSRQDAKYRLTLDACGQGLRRKDCIKLLTDLHAELSSSDAYDIYNRWRQANKRIEADASKHAIYHWSSYLE